jgi:hypothetical protein
MERCFRCVGKSPVVESGAPAVAYADVITYTPGRECIMGESPKRSSDGYRTTPRYGQRVNDS